MKAVWALTILTFLSLVLGEFGQIPFGSSNSISITDMLLAFALTLLLIWQVGIKKNLILPKVFSWMIFFWIFAALGLFFTGIWFGGLYLARFILYSLSLWLGYCLVGGKVVSLSAVKKLLWSVVVLFCIGTIYQLIALPDMSVLSQFGYDPHINRAFSTLLDPNFLGAILCLVLPIGILRLQKKWDINWVAGVLFVLSVLVLTFSRSAYLALFVEMLLYGFLRWKSVLLFLLLFAVLAFLLVPRFGERLQGALVLDASARERIESWRKGIEIWETKFVIGVGFDNIRYFAKQKDLVKAFSSDGGNSGAGVDSSIIFLMATVGILGVIFFVMLWVLIIICIGAGSERFIFLIALSGLFIGGQFVNSWFYPPIMLLVYFWAGALLGRKYNFSADLSS